MLAVCLALCRTVPETGKVVAADAGYLQAAALVEDTEPASSRAATAAAVEPPTPLFGMDTEPVAAGDVAAKWRAIEADIDREQQVLARCRAGAPCPAAAHSLLAIVAQGAGRGGLARVGLINRAVDLAITPTSDEAQWGVADHWSPPFETLQTRRGDCEDYAIVKYLALLQAGVSADDVKIVILRNLLPNEDHAAAAVRVDGAWLILDDRRLALVRDLDMINVIPRFVLDSDGARRFVPSSRIGQGPSASRVGRRRFVQPV